MPPEWDEVDEFLRAEGFAVAQLGDGEHRDAADAIRFLKALDADGWHNLVAFDPHRGGPPIDARTFPPNQWDAMALWLNDQLGRGHNLHYSVNAPRPATPNKKCCKDDIEYVRAVFIDLDPEPGKDLDQERERIRAIMEDAIDGTMPPSFIVDSGGGYQALWRIETVRATDENRRLAEATGDGMAHAFAGDSVQNLDRTLRLPGTVNTPNASKRRKGRIQRPATLYRATDAVYALETVSDQFPQPIGKERISEADAAEIRSYRDLIDFAVVVAADSFDDLPSELRDRFVDAAARSSKLSALWERGEKAGKGTGSDYVFALGFPMPYILDTAAYGGDGRFREIAEFDLQMSVGLHLCGLRLVEAQKAVADLLAGEERPAVRNLLSYVRQQMFYAAISLELHSRDPKGLNTSNVVADLQRQYTPFAFVDGTFFEASFTHLDGYSAIYYTYMWSLVIAKDMFTVFHRNGLLDAQTAARYRKAVLESGGSKPAADLVAGFLGRPYNFAAYEEWLNAN